MARHNDVGRDGEQQAAEYLQAQGFRLLERNWHAPHSRHELDIIAQGEGRLVIVEVKTRTALTHGSPLEAVDWKKVRAMASAAQAYVRMTATDLPLRFDVISIAAGELEHIRAAFVPPAKHY